MRVLYCKTFGLGNAIMAIPAIKALRALDIEVDVLIGTSPDDAGTREVFNLYRRDFRDVGFVYYDRADLSVHYDLAILAIPYDGRWYNGIHFRAKDVVDGRTRPDPSTTGLVSWEKSEIEYQMDNVRSLGYSLSTPNTRFMFSDRYAAFDTYYFGVGYKKDQAGFWKVKHWGNENFAGLAKRLLKEKPASVIYMTGDLLDVQNIKEIMKLVDNHRVIYTPTFSMKDGMMIAAGCRTYVGNDTGMMHVAASCDRNVLGLFFLENSSVKNPPACLNSVCIEKVDSKPSVDEVFEELMELQVGS